MPKSPEIYADTSAFIAFVDKSDSWHPLFRRLFLDPPVVATTPLVIVEGHGWFLRRYDSLRALQFLAMIETMSFLEIIPADGGRLEGSVGVLRKYADQDLTMVDAMGLVVMDELGIGSCWSTDRHLGLTGVSLVIHAG